MRRQSVNCLRRPVLQLRFTAFLCTFVHYSKFHSIMRLRKLALSDVTLTNEQLQERYSRVPFVAGMTRD